jgi:hypothetical protein
VGRAFLGANRDRRRCNPSLLLLLRTTHVHRIEHDDDGGDERATGARRSAHYLTRWRRLRLRPRKGG